MSASELSHATSHDGRHIAYRLEGPLGAPAIMLSNSIGTTHRMWDAQAAALSSRYRVVRYDSRGHGASDAPAGPYTIDILGHDALAVLETAGIEKATFCGLSLGGLVGQWLALEAPHVVERLVLANTAPRFAPRTLWDDRIAKILVEGMPSISQGAIARWFTPEFVAREPATVAAFRERFEALNPEGYAGCCAVLRDADTAAKLPSIEKPTLVIVGDFDQATPPALGKEIANAIPGAAIARLPTAHISCVEAPDAFTSTLENFATEPVR